MATKTIYVTAVNSTNAAHLTGGTAKIHFGYGYQSSYTVGYDGPLIENMPIVVDDSNPLVRVMMEIHKTGFWTPALIPPNLSPVNINISTAIADPVEQNLPVDPVQSSSPTVTLTGHVQNAAGDPLPNRRLKVMAIPFSEYTLSGYDESFKSYLTATTDSSGNLTLVVPRPALTALGPMNYYLYVADDDPDYWTYRPSTSFVSPASPASLSFNTLELRSYDGDNVAVLSVPQFKDALPGDSNRQVTVYRSDMYQVHPSVDVPDGVTEVVVDKLGAGPYIIEFFLNVPGHDWDGWWPHIDEENDPDAWYNTKATQFTLSPGRNDLGTFHFADYPATCTRTFPKKEAKLRKVGFSQKTAALLQNGPPLRWSPPIHYDDNNCWASVARGPLVTVPDGTDFRVTGGWLDIGDGANEIAGFLTPVSIEHLRYEPPPYAQLLDAGIVDVLSLPAGTYRVWYQADDAWDSPSAGSSSALSAVLARWTPPPLPSVYKLVDDGTDFRDLLRAGFSPRQARTWLRVKGMEPYFDFALYPHAGGTQRTIGGTQSLHIPAGFDISTVIAGYEYGITSSVDQRDAGESWWNLSQPVYRRSNGHAGPLTTAGEFYFWLHKSGGDQLAVWTDEAKAAVNALGASLGLPDRRLDALIRGGFTTAQARLLLETL